MSQLYPHHEQFKIHEWIMIVFSRETTGAIKRRVEDPPTQGSTPPDGDDPIHPDQHGDVPPNNDDEMLSGDEPEDPLDDDNQPDYNTGPDPDDDDDQEYIIPDDYGPPPDDDLDMPGIQDSGETHQPSSPSTPFSNPDIPIEEIADAGQDDDSPPGPDPTSEPIRVQRKQRQISTDSTDALPKAKVIIKRPKVQLPGLSLFQFLLRNLKMKKMKDLHVILLPQVHMIIQFHCLLQHQHRSRQVILRSQRNSSLHKEHQNWYHHKTMMMKQNHMKQTILLF